MLRKRFAILVQPLGRKTYFSRQLRCRLPGLNGGGRQQGWQYAADWDPGRMHNVPEGGL